MFLTRDLSTTVCQLWWLERWNPAAVRVLPSNSRRTLMNTTQASRMSGFFFLFFSFLITARGAAKAPPTLPQQLLPPACLPPPPLPGEGRGALSSLLVGVGASGGVLWERGISALPLSVSSPAVSQDAVGAAAALLLVALALGRRLAKLPRLLVNAAT